MSRRYPSLPILVIAPLAALIMMAAAASPALADEPQTLGSMTNHLYSALINLQTFLSLLSYILGIFFSITGLQMLKAHVDDPGRNPAFKAFLRLGAAAFFIFSPTLANMLVNSISNSGGVGQTAGLTFSNHAPGQVSDQDTGLDSALVRFVSSFAGPMLDDLLPFIAYAAGLIFMIIGLKRLALANGDGPQAPGGLGTMGTFFVAAALLAFGYIMYTLEGSIFGSTQMVSNPTFTGAADGALTEQANRAMWGVFIFLRIVGYISVLRALFMLRTAGEGGQVSMMAVCTHLVAGAMLANATAFVLAVQTTFVDKNSYILTQ